MTIRFSLVLISIFGIAGCASAPTVQAPTADSLTVHVQNDATGAMVMRGAYLHGFASPRCESQVKLANKLVMSADETLANVPLQPGKPFTFAVTTANAQGFKGNWGCSATATFIPVTGATYRASLSTANDNGTCKLTITDERNVAVPSTSPEYSCPRTFAGIVKNGQRYFHNPSF